MLPKRCKPVNASRREKALRPYSSLFESANPCVRKQVLYVLYPSRYSTSQLLRSASESQVSVLSPVLSFRAPARPPSPLRKKSPEDRSGKILRACTRSIRTSRLACRPTDQSSRGGHLRDRPYRPQVEAILRRENQNNQNVDTCGMRDSSNNGQQDILLATRIVLA